MAAGESRYPAWATLPLWTEIDYWQDRTVWRAGIRGVSPNTPFRTAAQCIARSDPLWVPRDAFVTGARIVDLHGSVLGRVSFLPPGWADADAG